MRNCYVFLISLVLCIVIKFSSTKFLLVEIEKENGRVLKQEGEPCGEILFEPDSDCGECDEGLVCDPYISPAPPAQCGKCVKRKVIDRIDQMDVTSKKKENAPSTARYCVPCRAATYACRLHNLACAAGMEVNEYCLQNPDTLGCKKDIVVTNGSLESVPHPDPKWLAIEGAEDCLTKMKMGDSTPVCVHLIQSEFCKNDAWKQLKKLVEAKELKQCYGSDKDLRIQLEQENRSQPGSEGDLQRSRDASNKGDNKCQVTMADQEGPFFEAGAPNVEMLVPKSDIIEEPHSAVTLIGRVLDKNCNPIRNATVQCWYGGGNPVHYSFPPDHLWYRGYVHTDKNGKYRFEATFPGLYDLRPILHYHMKAITKIKELTTQIYFRDHIPPAYEDYVKGRDTQYPKNISPRKPAGKLIEFDIVMDY